MLRILFLYTAALLTGCNQLEEPVQAPKPMSATAPKPVRVAAQPHQQHESVSKLGESEVRMDQPSLSLILPDKPWPRQMPLEVVAQVENPMAHPMELTLLSGMTADLILTKDKQAVWQFSHERMFTQALRFWTLDAESEKALTFTIDSRVLSALEPGQYQLQVELNTQEKLRSGKRVITLE